MQFLFSIQIDSLDIMANLKLRVCVVPEVDTTTENAYILSPAK